MFAPHVYVDRRNRLQQQFENGLLLFVGNADSPMNYAANAYHFRQDSSFLYYFGVDDPDLVAVIDVDAGRHVIFGNDFTIDDIVWRGPQPTIAERAAKAGVADTQPVDKLPALLGDAIRAGRRIHFLPQYRADNAQLLERLLGIRAEVINQHASIALAKAVVSQRAYKSAEEIAEIETALEVGHDMHVLAMKMAKPGMYEREVAGAIAGLVESRGGRAGVPDHLLGPRRDAAQPLPRQPDGGRADGGERLGLRVAAALRLRHHPDDSHWRPVPGTAARPLPVGAQRAPQGHRRGEAGCPVPRRPPARVPQPGRGPQGDRAA